MRIVTWNVGFQTRSRPFRDGTAEALAAFDADLIVLTEYVAHDSHRSSLEKLADLGLRHTLGSDRAPSENQVLILSRWELTRGQVCGPPIHGSVPSNVLHARVPAVGIEVLGIRMPDLSKFPKIRRAWWDWLEAEAAECVSRPFVIAGDFNTDTTYSKARCGERPAKMVAAGWRHAAPVDGASFITLRGAGKRIDHAFMTRHFSIMHSHYVTESGGYRLLGKPAEALSDHAALLVDFTSADQSAFG